MLDKNLLQALTEYTKNMTRRVELRLHAGAHAKRAELIAMLQGVASVSSMISFSEVEDTTVAVREGLTFELVVDDQSTGVLFSGVPGGHEFNSFVLALLQAGGSEIKLDAGLQAQIKAINEDLMFETFISLDCHVCPDVVQTLNQLALLNPRITNEMIDGALHQNLANERKVQGVPTVFVNKKPFSSGQISAAQIIEKITQQFNVSSSAAVQDDKVYDSVVVGGGPAAATASIYLARKGLEVATIAEKFGGQVSDTVGIENVTSISEITGTQLTHNIRKHLGDYPIALRDSIRVKSIEAKPDSDLKLLTLSTGEVLQARTVVIATGAQWRKLGVPGEVENVGKGVAYCPHCDGPYFKGKDVVVVGGGNSGVEAALDLAAITKSVTVVEFMDSLKADKVLVDKLQSTKNAKVILSAAVQEVIANEAGVTALELEMRESGEKVTQATDGVFVQIGLAPNSQFVGDLVDVNPRGEIVVSPKCQTSVEGIFACGDVTDTPYKQIIISMGEGAKAGLAAFEYLLTHKQTSA
ncbi:alkyl hydroperoxide reductase subunit F [Coraliomargarita algicola]|uniref:Alkyl hydroperoxide reductase subunit F n=1 Tax=Coraliomargarita algicola TaxID=3092156 RepID=A0ABZ0RQ11_9BACT|nr:alkyl hydroperoxide reductase subunit F [Coraliomargarita sp. J2-16]WPJ97060.1 alkyl hydroperoxide reductase subunit F [Coraliomargarita sp. J2-16]